MKLILAIKDLNITSMYKVKEKLIHSFTTQAPVHSLAYTLSNLKSEF